MKELKIFSLNPKIETNAEKQKNNLPKMNELQTNYDLHIVG